MTPYNWLVLFAVIMMPAIAGVLTAGIDRLADALERRET